MSDLGRAPILMASRLEPTGEFPHGKPRMHSRVVRALRWILPAIMAATVATLIAFIVSHALKRQDAEQRDAATPIQMINPHFFGRDSQGRPYTLSARQAARDERSFQRVLLSYPTVTLNTNGPTPSKVSADMGVYHEDSRMLFLKGHILADNDKASRFATDEAVVNTKTGQVSSPTPLTSRTAAGDLQARSFDIFDKGDKVVLKGGVHARLPQ